MMQRDHLQVDCRRPHGLAAENPHDPFLSSDHLEGRCKALCALTLWEGGSWNIRVESALPSRQRSHGGATCLSRLLPIRLCQHIVILDAVPSRWCSRRAMCERWTCCAGSEEPRRRNAPQRAAPRPARPWSPFSAKSNGKAPVTTKRRGANQNLGRDDTLCTD